MPWKYDNATGRLSRNGHTEFKRGYSGSGNGKNDATKQCVIRVGPIPSGKYKIAAPRTSTRTGPYVLDLVADGHNACGRTAFQIHGDSSSNPGTASKGCIILPRNMREKIWNSNDHAIEVTGPSWSVFGPPPPSGMN